MNPEEKRLRKAEITIQAFLTMGIAYFALVTLLKDVLYPYFGVGVGLIFGVIAAALYLVTIVVVFYTLFIDVLEINKKKNKK